jgi:hypothetical protein
VTMVRPFGTAGQIDPSTALGVTRQSVIPTVVSEANEAEESIQKQPSILDFTSGALTFLAAFATMTLCVRTY